MRGAARGYILLWLVASAVSAADAPPRASIAIKVVDPDGKGLPDVVLTFSKSAVVTATSEKDTTDATGSAVVALEAHENFRLYGLKLPPTHEQFCVELIEGLEFRPQTGWSLTFAEAPASILIKLAQPKARITGTVTDEAGRPVGGAKVFVRRDFVGRAKDNLYAALTAMTAGTAELSAVADAAGHYELRVPNGSYSLSRANGPAPSLLYLNAFGGAAHAVSETKELVLNAKLVLGGGIEASIVDPGGKPVEGARAMAINARADWNYGADGVYRAYGIAPGIVNVQLSPPDGSKLAPVSLAPLILERGAVTKLNVRLPLGATLSGRITTDDGQPVAHSNIFATVKTDGDGRYVIFGLPTGARTFFLNTVGNPWLEAPLEGCSVTVIQGGEFVKNFVLRRLQPATLSGTVSDLKGAAVPNAEVSVNSHGDYRPPEQRPKPVKTDTAGRYKLENLRPGRAWLNVKPPPELPLWESQSSDLNVSPDGGTQDVQLKPAALVRLKVVDVAGKPLAGVSLNCLDSVKHRNGHSSSGCYPPPTDAEGVTIARVGKNVGGLELKPDDRRVLEITCAPGELLANIKEIDIPKDAAGLEKTIVLRRGALIRGKVTDAAGKALEGIQLLISDAKFPFPSLHSTGNNHGQHTATSDAQGTFEFKNVRTGAFRLGVMSASLQEANLVAPEPESITVRADETIEQTIVVQQGGAIQGFVYAPDGKTLGAYVEAELQNPPAKRYSGRGANPADASPFEIRSVPPGKYVLRLTGLLDRELQDKLDAPKPTVTVKAGEVVQQDLKLTRKGAPHEDF